MPRVPGSKTPPDDAAALTAAQDRFIEVWGQMGSAWGISRTMAQVHALLYISAQDLCTDDVMDRLDISRGNASMSLRALVEWGIVERVHRRGDRKEYFRAEPDPWVMFRAILRQRLKREVEPLLASLYEIRDATRHSRADAGSLATEHNRRLESILNAFSTLELVSAKFIGPAGEGLLQAASLLASIDHDPEQQRRTHA
ncbi:MAG: ArsR family transcriptional regulator [Phycisphaeraceae bacterium]|nr:MAG: ArsR family transcriptional regulator [Phycisphaeraceae bacterium]